ncbi:hypothetical protein QOZ73_32830, partial [Pseudomonas aeruginosa]|uniref:hypothetical protein n=1 Tax=Pseudomonas aeruginosa TaxID=287 RepID=UPI00345A69E3
MASLKLAIFLSTKPMRRLFFGKHAEKQHQQEQKYQYFERRDFKTPPRRHIRTIIKSTQLIICGPHILGWRWRTLFRRIC